MKDPRKDPDGYQAHEDDQLARWAALTPIERLRGLEQMKEFCRRYLGAASAKGRANLSPRVEPPSELGTPDRSARES